MMLLANEIKALLLCCPPLRSEGGGPPEGRWRGCGTGIIFMIGAELGDAPTTTLRVVPLPRKRGRK